MRLPCSFSINKLLKASFSGEHMERPRIVRRITLGAGNPRKLVRWRKSTTSCVGRALLVEPSAFLLFYFAADFCASTDTTRKRICVPDSSFTLSVLDTTTGPGVAEVAPELRLRPFKPRTPCGMPELNDDLARLISVASVAADEPLAAFVLGDCLTVSGVCRPTIDCDDIAEEVLEEVPRLEVGERPTGVALDWRRLPVTIDGGSICEGSSTLDFLSTGASTACMTAWQLRS